MSEENAFHATDVSHILQPITQPQTGAVAESEEQEIKKTRLELVRQRWQSAWG